MKSLFFILLFFISQQIYAQVTIGDNYMFTKEQHDQIKKNLDDYRDLITKFNKMNTDFQMLTEQFELAKTLKNRQDVQINELQLELKQTKRDNMAYDNLSIQHDNLKIGYDNLEKEIVKLNKQLENKTKSVDYWQRKYSKQAKMDRGDRIVGNAVYAIITGCVLLIIYQDIANNYLHHK